MREVRLKLRGGLGNQLFQYCAGAYHARAFNAKLLIDDSDVYKHWDESRRSWLREIDYKETFRFSNVKWISKTQRMSQRVIRKMYAEEKHFNEDLLKSISFLSRDITISDWFHDKYYVEELLSKTAKSKQVLTKLVLKIPLTSEDNLIAPNRAALHIRLGDFKNTNWGVLPSNWYYARVRNLKGLNIDEIDCYSDDIVEAKSLIQSWKLNFTFRFPEVQRQLKPHELLYTLTRYPNFISSNSTLSWWASYFNQNQRPLILCNWSKHLRLENWTYYE